MSAPVLTFLASVASALLAALCLWAIRGIDRAVRAAIEHGERIGNLETVVSGRAFGAQHAIEEQASVVRGGKWAR